MLNKDSDPMSFNQIRKIAKVLEIPNFKVLEIDKYKKLAKNIKNLKIVLSIFLGKIIQIWVIMLVVLQKMIIH